ncbi:energy transducer TonB [Spirosoma sp. KNUC1025]|uniref:energy transducer TonB n=1 Tax=Spirosoma sp. KNUC1025 TaxID=2894082 RepID=UPI003865A327|nr:energy transducer TonB [Spirosoma sp. KNUC1025]
MKSFAFSLFAVMSLLCGCLAFCSPAIAQSRNQQIYTVAERQPEFPGGNSALSLYLAENIQVPSALIKKGPNIGSVSAKFIVDEFGYVHDPRVVTKPLDKTMEKGMHKYMVSIIAAVEKMPRWRPGEVDGKPVSVFYTLPIEVHMPY